MSAALSVNRRNTRLARVFGAAVGATIQAEVRLNDIQMPGPKDWEQAGKEALVIVKLKDLQQHGFGMMVIQVHDHKIKLVEVTQRERMDNN